MDGRPQEDPLAVHCSCVCSGSALLGDLLGVSSSRERDLLSVLLIYLRIFFCVFIVYCHRVFCYMLLSVGCFGLVVILAPLFFRFTASVLCCWSWEKGESSGSGPWHLGCTSEVFHAHSYLNVIDKLKIKQQQSLLFILYGASITIVYCWNRLMEHTCLSCILFGLPGKVNYLALHWKVQYLTMRRKCFAIVY